ncbi:rCG64366, partial [Rattus norvegicus]
MLETYSHLVTVVGSCLSKPHLITLLEQEKEPWMAVKEETDRPSPDLEAEYNAENISPENRNSHKQSRKQSSKTFDFGGSRFSNSPKCSTFQGQQSYQEGDAGQQTTNKEGTPTYTCQTLAHNIEKAYEC